MENTLPLGVRPLNGIPYTAMLVDDSRTMRLMLKQILLSLHFEVVQEAENGKNGLEKFAGLEKKPDYVFCDIEMPEMTGIEFVRELRKSGETVKIVMCTSRTDEDMVRELISLGIAGYIVKPFDRETVNGKLTKILNRPELIPKYIG
jgi:two-component system chemotaxis response regulator CheY